MKLFKFYNYWSYFIADKISDSEDNTTYYDFDTNESVLGTPNVQYNQVCFIEDKKCIWTHGQKYTSAEAAGVSQEDLNQAIKKHTNKLPKDLVKGIAPHLDYEQNWAKLLHYSIQKNANGDYTDITTYATYFERATDQATYVPDYTTYTDDNGVVQNSYTYFAYGHAGLMGVDDVRSMWQSWHAVRYMPEKLVGYTSAGADKDNAYITSYYKAEEGDEYPTTQKIMGGDDGKTWTGEFKKRKEFGRWKKENTNLPLADITHAGIITAADKTKLDSLGILSDFTVSSESGNTAGEKILRENFSPLESVFSNLVSVNFKQGDKISISVDLSKCAKTECEVVAIGKDISSWGKGLDVNKGVFHFYHKHSGSSHNILANYVDKNYQSGLKYNGSTGLAITGDALTIEVGYDTDFHKPYININGTNIIGTSSFMTVNNMNDWLDQKSLYIGSVSEASAGKPTNVLFNYIKIIKGAATSADGVKVQYSVGNDDNEFIIPNATATTNGAMSLEDKKKLDSLDLAEIKLPQQLTYLEDTLNNTSINDYETIVFTNSYGGFTKGNALMILPQSTRIDNYSASYNGMDCIKIVPHGYDEYSKKINTYMDIEIRYKNKYYKLNIDKMIELGLLV